MKEDLFSPQQSYQEIIKLFDQYLPADFFLKNKDVKELSHLLAMPQFKLLMEYSPSALCVLNHIYMRYDYFSDNIKGLLGYEAERYKQSDGFEFALSTFHPSHALIFSKQIVPKILEYYKLYASDDLIKTLRFTVTFLCRKSNHEYTWCMQQMSILETDDQGLPLFTLVFLSDVNHIKKDNQLDFIISKKEADGTIVPLLATTFFDQKQLTLLSKRELEVLTLISKGMTTPQIAELLSISQETVSSHRKKMLEKTDTKNTAELLQVSMKRGIL